MKYITDQELESIYVANCVESKALGLRSVFDAGVAFAKQEAQPLVVVEPERVRKISKPKAKPSKPAKPAKRTAKKKK